MLSQRILAGIILAGRLGVAGWDLACPYQAACITATGVSITRVGHGKIMAALVAAAVTTDSMLNMFRLP